MCICVGKGRVEVRKLERVHNRGKNRTLDMSVEKRIEGGEMEEDNSLKLRMFENTTSKPVTLDTNLKINSKKRNSPSWWCTQKHGMSCKYLLTSMNSMTGNVKSHNNVACPEALPTMHCHSGWPPQSG